MFPTGSSACQQVQLMMDSLECALGTTSKWHHSEKLLREPDQRTGHNPLKQGEISRWFCAYRLSRDPHGSEVKWELSH